MCNRDPSTTVLAHSNHLRDGKGMGLKADDRHAAYACHACHDVIDMRQPLPHWLSRLEVEQAFRAGIAETEMRLRRKGLLPLQES